MFEAGNSRVDFCTKCCPVCVCRGEWIEGGGAVTSVPTHGGSASLNLKSSERSFKDHLPKYTPSLVEGTSVLRSDVGQVCVRKRATFIRGWLYPKRGDGTSTERTWVGVDAREPGAKVKGSVSRQWWVLLEVAPCHLWEKTATLKCDMARSQHQVGSPKMWLGCLPATKAGRAQSHGGWDSGTKELQVTWGLRQASSSPCYPTLSCALPSLALEYIHLHIFAPLFHFVPSPQFPLWMVQTCKHSSSLQIFLLLVRTPNWLVHVRSHFQIPRGEILISPIRVKRLPLVHSSQASVLGSYCTNTVAKGSPTEVWEEFLGKGAWPEKKS